MSDPQNAGLVTVAETAPMGTIALRGDLSDATVQAAVAKISGLSIPAPLEVKTQGDNGLCWMSPDELLILCPYASVGDRRNDLEGLLGDTHALAVDVSDARAAFTLKGDRVRDVLAKLMPIDLSPTAMPVRRFRRSRLAQIPGAVWLGDPETAHILCFRSVAEYVRNLLIASADPVGAVGFHTPGLAPAR